MTDKLAHYLLPLAYRRLLLVALASVCLPSTVSAQLPTIELGSISIAAAQAGSEIPLSVTSGSRTEEIERFLFSQRDIQQRSMMSEPSPISGLVSDTGRFEVSIPATTAPGLCEVRALGRFGVSNPRRMLITRTAVQYVASESTSRVNATTLEVDHILFDHFYPRKRNYYKIHLTAGDLFHCVAYADALDSRAVISTQLLNPSGKILTQDRAVGAWPAEMRYRMEETGDYYIAAHDFLFQGGSEYPFVVQFQSTPHPIEASRLELDRLLRPVLTDAGPPTTQTGSKEVFQTLPVEIVGSFVGADSVTYDFAGTAGENLWIDVKSAQLDQRTDPRLIVYALATDPSGEDVATQILEQDDGPSHGGPALRIKRSDPYARFKVPSSGRYRIELRDNEGGPRPVDARGFALSVRRGQPSFSVFAYLPFETNNPAASRNHGSNLMLGGTESVHVIAVRTDGFDGPIELAMEGLPPSMACAPAVIPSGASEATLQLRSLQPANAGSEAIADEEIQVHSLRISAMAQVDGNAVRSLAQFATINWAATPTHNVIRSRSTDALMVRLNRWDSAPLQAQLGDGSTLEMARGGKLPLKITLERREGGKASCVLRPKALPAKTTLGEVTIQADKLEGNAELVIAADAPIGESTLWLQNETKLKWRANPQSLARAEAQLEQLKSRLEAAQTAEDRAPIEAAIQTANTTTETLTQQTAEQEYTVFLPTNLQRVRIVEAPFEFSASGCDLSAGQPCEVELKLVRKFDFTEAVTVSLSGKPPSGWQVTPVSMAAGADSAKLLIQVPVGSERGIRQLPIKLDYKFSGHTLSVTRSIELNIVQPSP